MRLQPNTLYRDASKTVAAADSQLMDDQDEIPDTTVEHHQLGRPPLSAFCGRSRTTLYRVCEEELAPRSLANPVNDHCPKLLGVQEICVDHILMLL